MVHIFAKANGKQMYRYWSVQHCKENEMPGDHGYGHEVANAVQLWLSDQSLTWLKYDVDDQDKMLVKVLRCIASSFKR